MDVILVKALFDFSSAEPSGLSFSAGDVIDIYGQLESGWWDGVYDGKRGWLPSNYVVELTEEETIQEMQRREGDEELDASSDLWATLDTYADGEDDQTDETDMNVNDFWIPRVTAGGQIFYYNFKTHETRQDLPPALEDDGQNDDDEEEEDDFQVASAINSKHPSLSSAQTRTTTGSTRPDSPLEDMFAVATSITPDGYPGGASLSLTPAGGGGGFKNATASLLAKTQPPPPEPWKLSMTDDGSTVFYYHPITGERRLDYPSSPFFQGVSSQRTASPDMLDDGPSLDDDFAVGKKIGAGFSSELSGRREKEKESVEDRRLRRELEEELLSSPEGQGIPGLALKVRRTVKAFKDSIEMFGKCVALAERLGYVGETLGDAHELVQVRLDLVTTATRNLVYVSGVFNPEPTSSSRAPYSPKSLTLQPPPEALRKAHLKVQHAFSRLLFSVQTYLRCVEWIGEPSPPEMTSTGRVTSEAEEVERAVVAFGLEAERARVSIFGSNEGEGEVRLNEGWLDSVGLGNIAGGHNGFSSELNNKSLSKTFGLDVTDLVALQLLEAAQQAFNRLGGLKSDPSTPETYQPYLADILKRTDAVYHHLHSFDIAAAIDLNGEVSSSSAVKDSAYASLVQEANIYLSKFETGMDSLSVHFGRTLAHFGILPLAELLLDFSNLRRTTETSVSAFQSLTELAFLQAQAVRSGIQGQIGAQKPRADRSSLNPRRSSKTSDLTRSSISSQRSRAKSKHASKGLDEEVGAEQERLDDVGDLQDGKEETADTFPTSLSSLSLNEKARSGSIGAYSFSSIPSIPPLSQDGMYGWSPGRVDPPGLPVRRRESMDTIGADSQYSNPRSSKGTSLLLSVEVPWYLGIDYDPADVVFVDGEKDLVKGATLDALVVKLTTHLGDSHSHDYRETFLMTFKSFTTPAILLEKLQARFYLNPPDGLSTEELGRWKNEKQRLIWLKVINALKCWVTENYIEANEQDTIRGIESFVEGLPDSVKAREAGGLIRVLQNRKLGSVDGGLNARKTTLANSEAAPPVNVPRNKIIKVIDMDPLEVARQLTIQDVRLFSKIRPAELLMKAWSDMSDPKKAANIKACIRYSNVVSKWVQVAILSEFQPKHRVLIMKAFIQIADRCLSINNFSCMASIVAGLVSSSISRLKRTIDLLSPKIIAMRDAMIKLVDSERNFGAYKDRLGKANGPAVPFLGVYLTYLTFIEDGNQNVLPGDKKLINFSKRTMTAGMMKEIQAFQLVRYNFTTAPPIQTYLDKQFSDASYRSDEQLYERSMMLEPREQEPERLTRMLSESGFL